MAEFHNLRTLQDVELPEAWKALDRAAEVLTKKIATADMPSLDHLTRADYQHVYEPAEDTYLLIDALLYDFKQGVFDDGSASSGSAPTDGATCNGEFVVLELGCGTGVPTVMFRQEWFKRYPRRTLQTFVTDINPRALQVALQTDECNNRVDGVSLSPIQAVRCDLATDLLQTLAGSVDVLIFNPPYVVTPDAEVVDFADTTSTTTTSATDDDVDDSIIAAAWAGGARGRRVVDRALPQIQRLLRGRAYLVTVDDNQPAELADLCQNQHQLKLQPLLRRRAHNEYLTVQTIVPL